MRRWTRRRAQPIDQLLVGLSRAADHSKLWLVLAPVAASFGGTRGRRAAERGVLALAFTSAIVNGPLKLLIGRRRPPPRRRIRRMPRTSSFPSGHSASAFAFAVAATRELPEAGRLLLPLAASVAYSRVYLGVHYPSDVVAGAAFGAAVGTAARFTERNLGIDRASVPRGSQVGPEAVLVSARMRATVADSGGRVERSIVTGSRWLRSLPSRNWLGCPTCCETQPVNPDS